MSDLRYSIVLPVFHETANIGPFCCRARAELPPGYEVLVCHDTPDDTTLTALAVLEESQRPPRVRPILNTLGPGVRFAIEAGMKAATAPVVVVMMADMSDDLAQVERMVLLCEQGCALVTASRYMPGGRQLGGPWLKRLLSRAAGISLHRLAGLPTHDATNSFKAYRRDFLARTPIESTAGFCLGLELTVKAFLAGERIGEVPVTWRDRAAGTSRFRLWKWLPHYLRWYFHCLLESSFRRRS